MENKTTHSSPIHRYQFQVDYGSACERKSVSLPEDNKRKYLYDSGIEKNFLNRVQETVTIKESIKSRLF